MPNNGRTQVYLAHPEAQRWKEQLLYKGRQHQAPDNFSFLNPVSTEEEFLQIHFNPRSLFPNKWRNWLILTDTSNKHTCTPKNEAAFLRIPHGPVYFCSLIRQSIVWISLVSAPGPANTDFTFPQPTFFLTTVCIKSRLYAIETFSVLKFYNY